MIIIEMGIDRRALGNAGEERPSGWYSEWADSKTKEIVRSDKWGSRSKKGCIPTDANVRPANRKLLQSRFHGQVVDNTAKFPCSDYGLVEVGFVGKFEPVSIASTSNLLDIID